MRCALLTTLFAGFALAAGAAEITEAPGGQLNGASPGSLPAALKAGDLVTGPATIKTAAGGTLILAADGVLEVQAPDKGVELFFLRKGALRGEIGHQTSVAIPTGWLAVPKSGPVEFYARTVDATRGFVQVRRGTALVVYEAAGGGFPKYNFLLQNGQGVEIWSPGRGDVAFLTGQDNPGEAVLSAQVTSATEIRLWIPKATGGEMRQEEEGRKTRVVSEAGSFKGGQIRGEIRVSEDLKDNLDLGPGTFGLIDNITGKVLAFAEVAFEILERAISLTSEFTSVATSNFFGIK